jgi:phage terminase large subunit
VIQTVTTGYTPRPFQEKLHASLKRFNVLVCHRRFGKTVFAVNETIDQALRNNRKNPQYAYLAPYFAQAKRIAWDYLKDAVKNIPGVVINESELRVDIPRPWLGDRIRIMLLGADNPNALRGLYLDGVILDEYAEMVAEIWTQIIRPALSDREGWAIFMGTPKGQNHFYEIYKYARTCGLSHWFAALYKASETKIVPQAELDDARALMSEEEYEQEFECSFTAALVGAYFSKQMGAAERDGRIRDLPIDPSLPVRTYWDLGVGDSTVIWFVQRHSREHAYRVVDYLEDSSMPLDFYAKKLKEKGYYYDQHFLPHDGAARELQTGKSRQEFLRSLGVHTQITPKHAVDDGIQAVRMILPMCYFDQKRTERGRECLINYRRKWDEKNKVFSSAPLHDWASHGADGFRTFAMNAENPGQEERRRNLPRQSKSDYDPMA